MEELSTISLEITKSDAQAHGANAAGRQIFSRRISRGKVLAFFADQPRCLVALEACGGARHWARELSRLGHDVRLIPPAYVKPFVGDRRTMLRMPRQFAKRHGGLTCASSR